MADVRGRVIRARDRARRARLRYALHARVEELEAGLQEQRQLSRRVAELTDLVTELLVPLSRRDDEEVDVLLRRYRDSI